MKKLFLSLVAALMSATVMFAQSSLLATLSHEGNISVFHGATALKEAMTAAEHGDIITLSSGRYDAITIDKAVTLRGAGMEEDTTNGTQPTRIVGDFKIAIPDNVPSRLSIEGIYMQTVVIQDTLSNAIFQKCSFLNLGYTSSSKTLVNSLIVVHCTINERMAFPTDTYSTASFINSYISKPENGYDKGALEFTNCYIYDLLWIKRSVFTNCFFDLSDSRTILHSTNMCYYCVSWGNGNIFANVSQLTNTNIETREAFAALFKPDTFYELTDEAKATYLGNDGTEVGMYGSNLPYSTHILSPQITKCNVAAKTTTDGKLSVDIEVKAAE